MTLCKRICFLAGAVLWSPVMLILGAQRINAIIDRIAIVDCASIDSLWRGRTVASIAIRNLAAAIRARVGPPSRVDLELPAREPMREPARFGRARK